MSDQLPVPAASNTFERIKRVRPDGGEFWSARELARVLEYREFRNLSAAIAKAREACTQSGHAVSDHFVLFNEMVGIGSGAQSHPHDLRPSRQVARCRALYHQRLSFTRGKRMSAHPSARKATHYHLPRPQS